LSFERKENKFFYRILEVNDGRMKYGLTEGIFLLILEPDWYLKVDLLLTKNDDEKRRMEGTSVFS